LRLGELTRLRVSDLETRDRQPHLRVQGKGERDRLVPLPNSATRLRTFLSHRPREAGSDRMFLSSRRSRGILEPLSTSGVHQLIRSLAREAGLSKRVYPHLLRHSFATEALARGMNPIQLADILGHSSL